MISFRSAFEQAARQGKLVYYPLDMHWNEEGREIAASVTAEALRADLSDKRAIAKASATQTQPRQVVELESKNKSLMERTISGTIRFWDHGAEELYGWKKEEAIGKVSHKLLQTQFPESLEKINDQLLRDGRWQGKLVHVTRDGRRVEVVSEWIWDPKTNQEEILEINQRS
jgi:PAS domain S-box-containing protein